MFARVTSTLLPALADIGFAEFADVKTVLESMVRGISALVPKAVVWAEPTLQVTYRN